MDTAVWIWIGLAILVAIAVVAIVRNALAESPLRKRERATLSEIDRAGNP